MLLAEKSTGHLVEISDIKVLYDPNEQVVTGSTTYGVVAASAPSAPRSSPQSPRPSAGASRTTARPMRRSARGWTAASPPTP